ncbi:MAG TPA: helix-turn-helix domain-containing protein, partial [Marinagarivorans sp.]
ALFFYITAITQADFDFNRKQLVHLIPTVVIIVILLSLGINLSDLKGISESPYRRLMQDIWLIMKGLPAVYALACIPVALSASHLMQNFYSNDNTTGKNWLSLLCIGYAIFWGWTFLSQLFGGTLSRLWQQQTSIGDILGIASNYMGFGLLMVLFSYSVSVTQQQLGRALSAAKPKNAPKSPPVKVDTLAEAIKASMENDKLYLQTNLTAEQFAEHLGRATRDISMVINQQFGKNFFEFINSYRVAEAQRLLVSQEHKDTSITDILYLAGFNSKSAFQRFFKRITGISPSEYRANAKQPMQDTTDHQA